jgi:hypothetical protein
MIETLLIKEVLFGIGSGKANGRDKMDAVESLSTTSLMTSIRPFPLSHAV